MNNKEAGAVILFNLLDEHHPDCYSTVLVLMFNLLDSSTSTDEKRFTTQ